MEVITPKHGEIRGWKDKNWADIVKVDKTLVEVSSTDYDALALPGGILNPDKLRTSEKL